MHAVFASKVTESHPIPGTRAGALALPCHDSRHIRRRSVLVRDTSIAVLLALACACEVEHPDEATAAAAIAEGTPAAVGVLAFVNAPATTFEVLDDGVPLDRRAAEGIMARRPLGSIAALDDVPYVGPAALRDLEAYARAAGYIPEDDDVLGTFEGVAFTVAEAELALRLVNEESDGVLRYEVGLDRRAVDGILAGRPVHSVAELAELYWVGPVTLQRIRDFVRPPAPGEPIDCRGSFECPGELRCVGIPSDGSSELGICRDLRPIEGAGEPCTGPAGCGDGLVCVGAIAYGEGWCSPAWMSDTFTSTTIRHIPADTPTYVATSVTVRGQASVPVDLVVRLDLAHDDPGALRIWLRDPNGDTALVHDRAPQVADSIVVRGGISGDDQVNGRWLIQIDNAGGSGTGTLRGWTLDLTSRWD